MAPLTKICPKMVLSHKGGSLCVKDVFVKKNFLVPGEIPLGRLRSPTASIQNDAAILCDYNGLDCLTVTNGTTGAQRFFPALSHRASSKLALPTTSALDSAPG
jgi:hypothetical protein